MLDFIRRLFSAHADRKAQPPPTPDHADLTPIKPILVGGIPTWQLADQKDDLGIMLQCCDAEEAAYWSGVPGKRACAAPFYFARAAILLKKARDDAGEIAICERWIAIEDDYAAQDIVREGLAAQVQKSPHSAPMRLRHEKAKARLAKKDG